MRTSIWAVACAVAMVNASSEAKADALSQPPVCSARNVIPANTDLDFDDKKAVEEAWTRTGKGCAAFLDRKGRHHLFVFQDVAPSHQAGEKRLRPVRLGEYDFVANVYNNRFLAPALELQPGDILHVRALDCLGELPPALKFTSTENH